MTLEDARESFRRNDKHGTRLRLKPKASRGGYLDGAWWPRSDDLTTELPDLIAALPLRPGAVDRVSYNPDEWIDAPTELAAGGRVVHLDGCRRRPPGTLEVLDANRDKIVLLVVPSHTKPDQAHAIVMAAAAPHDTSSVDTLLMISEQDRRSRTRAAAAEDRWNARAVPARPGDVPAARR